MYLQKLIKEAAQQSGWHAVIEQPVSNEGRRVDVALERNGVRIACEISISTSAEHEMANAKKCLAAGYDRVCLVTSSEKSLAALKKAATHRFSAQDLERLGFLLPEQLVAQLNEPDPRSLPTETISRGYKVRVTQGQPDLKLGKERRDAVTALIAQSLKRMKQRPKGSE